MCVNGLKAMQCLVETEPILHIRMRPYRKHARSHCITPPPLAHRRRLLKPDKTLYQFMIVTVTERLTAEVARRSTGEL